MQRVNSGGAGVIFKRDFDEYTGRAIYKIEIVVYILAALAITIRTIADRQSGEEPSLFWWNALFLLSITAPICNVPVFMTVPVTRDKLNGTVAGLLATPLSPEAIIRGKSRAVFLPGFLPAFFAPLFLLATRLFTGGALHVTQATSASFFTVCVVSPLFCYGLTKLSVRLSMIIS